MNNRLALRQRLQERRRDAVRQVSGDGKADGVTSHQQILNAVRALSNLKNGRSVNLPPLIPPKLPIV